jgi:hypothetical protein
MVCPGMGSILLSNITGHGRVRAASIRSCVDELSLVGMTARLSCVAGRRE